jgi:outer membrane lipoprotein SlyB
MIRKTAIAAAMLMAGTFSQAQAQDGGLVGGLLGAGAGAVIGGAATGRAGGAAAGAIIGGVTGAIIGSESDRRRYRARREGFYFNSRGRCWYEYPNGQVVKVANYPCR